MGSKAWELLRPVIQNRQMQEQPPPNILSPGIGSALNPGSMKGILQGLAARGMLQSGDAQVQGIQAPVVTK